jgi:uncharacterized membrane protein YhaH (DUF805 family)
MIPIFSVHGRLKQLPYALWSLGVFFSQHLIVWIALRAHGVPPVLDLSFFLVPLRSLTVARPTDAVSIMAFAYLLVVAWALAALAFRRAKDANVSEWIATLAMVPGAQIPIVAGLCVLPSRVPVEAPGDVPQETSDSDSGWPSATLGVLAGMGLTLFAVAVSALGFGVYGYGIFVASPFLVGMTTADLANRTHDFTEGRTMRLVSGATLLSGIGLVLFALEGLVCLILASPLGILVAIVGGVFGRAIALARKRPARQALSGFALLPIVFALESVLPPSTSFDTLQTISVDAPPDAVWKSILRMDRMDEPTALPFRLGMAYPLRGEVLGEGVGAVRHGEFSTGTAIERVTEWVPNRMLAFVVVNDVPALRELSPYEHVHAPHVVGYFRTTLTSFELQPRPDGGTEIVERTSHELRLDPALYWLPMARWIVDANNARVLAHIKRQAERSVRLGLGLR